jgi:hypothetical protein
MICSGPSPCITRTRYAVRIATKLTAFLQTSDRVVFFVFYTETVPITLKVNLHSDEKMRVHFNVVHFPYN